MLGLGASAVVGVATDDRGRIDVARSTRRSRRSRARGCEPIAIVATAGTTDLGAIDPLAAIAERARACGAWLHVDAAVGSALALSPRLAPLLAGIEQADSITADLHKLWFMPIGASALLVRDVALLGAVHHHSDYLNRAEDEADGVLNLVGRSLDTSRRFDALKILVGLRSTGRRQLAAMVERLVELARTPPRAVDAHDELELLAEPSTVMVVFRWRPAGERGRATTLLDAVNVAAQRALLRSGRAVVGRTRLDGRVALKLTLVNPLAGAADVRALLELVAGAARAGERDDARRTRARTALPLARRGRRRRHRDAAELLHAGGRRLAGAAGRERARARAAGDDDVAVLTFARHARHAARSASRHLSPTHRHRFRLPVEIVVGGGEPVAALETVAAAARRRARRARRRCGARPARCWTRMRASVDAVGASSTLRDGEIDALWGARR